jgi:hypothetical protein
MTYYVPMEYKVEVGDVVALQLMKGPEVLTIAQVSVVKRVAPSSVHKECSNMNEVEV